MCGRVLTGFIWLRTPALVNKVMNFLENDQVLVRLSDYNLLKKLPAS
jgi:hypothetical protein